MSVGIKPVGLDGLLAAIARVEGCVGPHASQVLYLPSFDYAGDIAGLLLVEWPF